MNSEQSKMLWAKKKVVFFRLAIFDQVLRRLLIQPPLLRETPQMSGGLPLPLLYYPVATPTLSPSPPHASANSLQNSHLPAHCSPCRLLPTMARITLYSPARLPPRDTLPPWLGLAATTWLHKLGSPQSQLLMPQITLLVLSCPRTLGAGWPAGQGGSGSGQHQLWRLEAALCCAL